jgi:hypothetical protein
MSRHFLILITALLIAGCIGNSPTGNVKTNNMETDSVNRYGYNRDFLSRYVKIIELKNGQSAITIVPGWQGRVMTSTTNGDKGFSSGWINHKLIASGIVQPHINAYGGEERLWLGPEGGQFSIYFKKGDSFTYDNWQVPAYLDTTPFEVISVDDSSTAFGLDIETRNFSGTTFRFRIEREICLLNADRTLKETGINSDGLSAVSYRSDNRIINTGEEPWSKEKGLLSIWMLGMFNPSPSVVVAIPFKSGEEQLIGPPVNDNYFGKIGSDRLKVTGTHIFFRADGKSRGKIGLSPERASGIMGSYDAANNLLTLLICKIPEGDNLYVNSSWQIQEDPYSGDAFNSYNDGPLEDGSQMGPFYELEASSPARELKFGELITHTQYTIHLTGDIARLNKVSLEVLGVSLEEIENAFR